MKLLLFSYPIVTSRSSLSFQGSPTPVSGWVQQCGEPNWRSKAPIKARGSRLQRQLCLGALTKFCGFSSVTNWQPLNRVWPVENMLFGLYLVSVKFFQKLGFERQELGRGYAGWNRYMLCILEFINPLENICQELTICQALFQELYVHELTWRFTSPASTLSERIPRQKAISSFPHWDPALKGSEITRSSACRTSVRAWVRMPGTLVKAVRGGHHSGGSGTWGYGANEWGGLKSHAIDNFT